MTKINSTSEFYKTSALILGGGLVGGLLAVFLKNNSIPFVMIESDSPQNMLDVVSDGRTTAVSLGSQKIFDSLGLWRDELLKESCPIKSIQVYEKGSFCNLQFDHNMVSSDPMGYIIQNMYLRQTILRELENHPTCFYTTTVKSLRKNETYVEAELSNGSVIKASLLVSAEGRKSPSRELIGPQIKSRDYAQKALVVHVEHEKPHEYRAFEVFTKDGPFAILPLSHPENKKSGIVFAKSSKFDWDKQTNLMIEDEIKDIFPFYGDLKIVSKRWHFPLSTFDVDKITGGRQVLIGDAAHGMHPLAGQGVNLGWRDAHDLAILLIKHHKLGLDIGSSSLLNLYEKKRKIDVKTLLNATDFMNQLFEHPSKTVYYLRNLGLSFVNQIPPLKRFFIKKAMGV